MRTVIRLWFLLSAFAVGAQDSALVDTNGVLVHPTNFLSANGIAPLASPALSGNPTAPTATAGDNDTSISTTAFVTAAIEALKALRLWQDTNAVLTTLANLTGGNSSNFFKGTGAFAQVTTNDIPDLVTMLGALQPLDADLTTIAGLNWTDTNTFLRGDKTLSRDGQNWTNLTATQLLLGTVPTNVLPGALSLLSTSDGSALTNINASNLASGTAPTNVLPGALSPLSTWNGGGALTNTAFPLVSIYTNANTTNRYTIPTGARHLLIEAIGVGGSGGSGRRGAASSVRCGGGGGGGGGYSYRFLNVSTLWTNLISIYVPAVGTPGGAVVTDDSNGTNASAGGSVYVNLGAWAGLTYNTNTLMQITPGGIGGGGTASAGAAGAAAAQGPAFTTGAGAAASTTGLIGVASAQVNLGIACSGGGSGGGITAGDAWSAGGASGSIWCYARYGNAGGLAEGADGVDGYYSPYFTPGTGGGGGASGVAANGGAGGDANCWGGGGGGGGASANGRTSGAGGLGGPAIVRVIAY